MPELPEVETVRRGLLDLIQGKRIVGLLCHYAPVLEPDPEMFRAAVAGRRVLDALRHGKFLFLSLEAGTTVALHLRMTGQLFRMPLEQVVDTHTHLELFLEGGPGEPVHPDKLVYRDVRKFGRFTLLEESLEEFLRRKRLGPDALDISERELEGRLSRTRRCLKAALLDQSLLAGLGNIYADEILFACALSPLCRADSLRREQIRRLLRSTRDVLASAMRRGGTTISDYVDSLGRRGSYQEALQVYGRSGQPCPRCGQAIARRRIAGRSAFLCLRCQRL